MRGSAGARRLALCAGLGLAPACVTATEANLRHTSVPDGSGEGGSSGVAVAAATSAGTPLAGGNSGGGAAASYGRGPALPLRANAPFPAAPGASLMAADGSACLALSGAAALLAPCDGSTAQRWRLTGGGIQSLAQPSCLAAPANAGAGITVATCNVAADATQQFTVTQGYMFPASSLDSGSLCLSNAGGSGLAMAPCTTDDGLALDVGWDGMLVGVGSAPSQCLAGSGSGGVALAPCNGSSADQLWVLYGAGALALPSLSQCLDVANQNAAEGSGVVLAACSGAPTQSWNYVGSDATLRNNANTSLYLAAQPAGEALVLTAATRQAWSLTK